MKVLIEIDENIYQHAKEGSEDSNDEWTTMRAVAEGLVLNNHDDLLERSAVFRSLFDYVDGIKSLGECVDDCPVFIKKERC